MTKEKIDAIHLIEDVIQIAKWLLWGDHNGQDYAESMIYDIHKGKHGSTQGIWVQAERAMKAITMEEK